MPPAVFGARALLRACVFLSAALLCLGLAVAAARAEPAHVSDRLSVEVTGAGPDVILIPGLGSSREVFRPLADRLKATHRVHLVQLAGFAGEPWTHGDGPFLDPAVAALGDYVVAAKLHEPAVIGHSLGGLAGLLLAQRRPESVGRLMTVDALPFYGALFGPEVTAQTARPFAERGAAGVRALDQGAFAAQQATMAQTMARDPAIRSQIVRWSMLSERKALARALLEVMTTDARPGLPAMKIPVTALYAVDADGGPSPALTGALWLREYDPLPGVKLVRIDGARHFLMADQPERFASAVETFLK